MKKIFSVAAFAIGIMIAIVARGHGRAEAPSPRPMIGATIPMVSDLAKTIHFYHDLRGLQGSDGDPRVNLGWYPTVPFPSPFQSPKDESSLT